MDNGGNGSEPTPITNRVSLSFPLYFSDSCSRQAFDIAVSNEPSDLEPDIERVFASGILTSDPYQFRDGLFDDNALTLLRRRGKGKHVAKYQLRQNDVSLSYPLSVFISYSSPADYLPP